MKKILIIILFLMPTLLFAEDYLLFSLKSKDKTGTFRIPEKQAFSQYR